MDAWHGQIGVFLFGDIYEYVGFKFPSSGYKAKTVKFNGCIKNKEFFDYADQSQTL
jgi:hypothetical protein